MGWAVKLQPRPASTMVPRHHRTLSTRINVQIRAIPRYACPLPESLNISGDSRHAPACGSTPEDIRQNEHEEMNARGSAKVLI